MKHLFLFVIFGLLSTTAFSQKTIRGKVIDVETLEPLAGATIAKNGTLTGTVSDADGNFELTVPDSSETQEIVFSYIGYEILILDLVAGQKNLTIALQARLELDEVVVTALGL